MSTVPSVDAKAVVRAVDRLTTQVRRIADALTTPVVRTEVAADDDATTAVYCPLCPDAPRLFTPAEATDHFRTRHPEQRLVDGPWPMLVPPDEQERNAAALHRQGLISDSELNAVFAAHDTATTADEDAQRTARRDSLRNLLDRADRGALTYDEGALLRRHIVDEVREADTAGERARKAERAADLLADSHRRAEQADAVTAETKRLLERRTTTLRQRAETAETELHVLRAGLRANGADPTQIQNLWAQIRLRNRQWRDAKRERDEAQAAIERVRAVVVGRAQTTSAGISDHAIGQYDLAVEVLAALDGTEQPTTEQP